jgi:hypothetical protein
MTDEAEPATPAAEPAAPAAVSAPVEPDAGSQPDAFATEISERAAQPTAFVTEDVIKEAKTDD